MCSDSLMSRRASNGRIGSILTNLARLPTPSLFIMVNFRYRAFTIRLLKADKHHISSDCAVSDLRPQRFLDRKDRCAPNLSSVPRAPGRLLSVSIRFVPRFALRPKDFHSC